MGMAAISKALRRLGAVLLAAVGLLLTAAPAEASRPAARGTQHMVATDHPIATEAGLAVLRAGGNALDAALAAALALGVVEPHASGIGGGGALLYYDAAAGTVSGFDGRDAAPSSAGPERFIVPETGRPALPRAGGMLVALPGFLRMAELAHARHGRLAWADLFDPAIKAAREGFPVSAQLAAAVAANAELRRFPATRHYFFERDGTPKPPGATLRNADLGATLATIAAEGPDAFYSGVVAFDIARAVGGAALAPAPLPPEELLRYEAREPPPLCAPYRTRTVCSAAPPMSGMTLLGTLGLLEHFDLSGLAPDAAEAIDLIGQASRLAYADRLRYLADPAFRPVPAPALIDARYLADRARQILPGRSRGRPSPGNPFRPAAGSPDDPAHGLPDDDSESTTHVSVVDRFGNAAALTTTLGRDFGSKIMVRGFLLNGSMAAFSAWPEIGGRIQTNAVEPLKRPRSTMTPTLVFDGDGRLLMAVGSPGGVRIVAYVLKTLVAALDWNMGIQQAIELPNHSSRTESLELEAGGALDLLARRLAGMNNAVRRIEMPSGINAVMVTPDGLAGGADPRRGGVARGD
jgi:gamma-glutamyltranspeptidase / glutathione hydrolase